MEKNTPGSPTAINVPGAQRSAIGLGEARSEDERSVVGEGAAAVMADAAAAAEVAAAAKLAAAATAAGTAEVTAAPTQLLTEVSRGKWTLYQVSANDEDDTYTCMKVRNADVGTEVRCFTQYKVVDGTFAVAVLRVTRTGRVGIDALGTHSCAPTQFTSVKVAALGGFYAELTIQERSEISVLVLGWLKTLTTSKPPVSFLSASLSSISCASSPMACGQAEDLEVVVEGGTASAGRRTSGRNGAGATQQEGSTQSSQKERACEKETRGAAREREEAGKRSREEERKRKDEAKAKEREEKKRQRVEDRAATRAAEDQAAAVTELAQKKQDAKDKKDKKDKKEKKEKQDRKQKKDQEREERLQEERDAAEEKEAEKKAAASRKQREKARATRKKQREMQAKKEEVEEAAELAQEERGEAKVPSLLALSVCYCSSSSEGGGVCAAARWESSNSSA